LFATFLLGQQAAQVTNDPGQPSQAQEPNAAPAPQSNAENPPDPGFPTNPVEAAPQPQPGGPSNLRSARRKQQPKRVLGVMPNSAA